MKTTNFEISKKLKEIGFEANSDYSFIKRDNQEAFLVKKKDLSDFEIMNEVGDFIKSYDLETLINALPKTIEFKQKKYCFWMQWSGSSDCLLIGYVNGNVRAVELEVSQEENESLADTVGRLLIKLFKELDNFSNFLELIKTNAIKRT